MRLLPYALVLFVTSFSVSSPLGLSEAVCLGTGRRDSPAKRWKSVRLLSVGVILLLAQQTFLQQKSSGTA